jgi:hypothetical protein
MKMAYTRAYYSEDISAPADQVWPLIGAFNRLPAILPKLVAKSEMDKTGLVRILTIRDGTLYKRYEQLIKYDAPNRTLVYELIDKQRSRVPVKNYTATIRVRKISNRRCTVTWSGRFEPKHGTPKDVRSAVEAVYVAGIAGVKKQLGINTRQK